VDQPIGSVVWMQGILQFFTRPVPGDALVRGYLSDAYSEKNGERMVPDQLPASVSCNVGQFVPYVWI
jgi:hypothetical protein